MISSVDVGVKSNLQVLQGVAGSQDMGIDGDRRHPDSDRIGHVE